MDDDDVELIRIKANLTSIIAAQAQYRQAEQKKNKVMQSSQARRLACLYTVTLKDCIPSWGSLRKPSRSLNVVRRSGPLTRITHHTEELSNNVLGTYAWQKIRLGMQTTTILNAWTCLREM